MEILGAKPNARIPGLEGPRANCTKEGILDSDVILVPLEDGDRCEALVSMGKTVLVVDLNPLSRTAQMASVTMVDELSRVVANMNAHLDSGQQVVENKQFSNNETIHRALQHIATYLQS